MHIFHDWTKWGRLTKELWEDGRVVAEVTYLRKKCKECNFEKVRKLR